ncbi:MAG: hypothetical protein JRN26_00820 [Nitrososphaerota archaeon]|nr:hypothetical protein [Nitrososphaerota archaeon]MDG6927708.1 hypothetical protein [Nitrososphaerota archaeon]MDG6930175.1 hypothetical protein [Nitrososphaerota archaeon]MDG6932048.1 hypothetical protein [Nitrososphaerota archaeon]MDG6935423.1 hypothetical protein [Nitrososphaerota archaeon]
MAELMGNADYAKYPFLSESTSMAISRMRGLNLGALDGTEVLGHNAEEVFSIVRVRLNDALGNGDSPDLADISHEISLASFIFALIILRAANDQRLTSRFALAEARRSERYMGYFLAQSRRSQAVPIIEHTCGINLTDYYGEGFLVDISDYLKNAIVSQPSWKLVNRWVIAGKVFVKDNEILHIFRESAAKSINQTVQKMPEPVLKGELANILSEIMVYKPKVVVKPIEGGVPPCVQVQLDRMKKGENIPHAARFLIASFFINRGYDIQSVINLFTTSPDFSEKITRYQVEQIAGKKENGPKYMVPSCSKLASEGLCFKTEECDSIKNPVQFTGKRQKERSSS